MRLPQSLLDSPLFIFGSSQEFFSAVKGEVPPDDLQELQRLIDEGLPPVVSASLLAVLFGLNPGIVQSIIRNPNKYYRQFSIPKGNGVRVINSPRVALKIIQKWLSIWLQNKYAPPSHVYGFIPGRSHVLAAAKHTGAKWIFSVDIKDFFPSTSDRMISDCMVELGYSQEGAEIIKKICCLNGGLAQGSPASPILSNIAFKNLDIALERIAIKYDTKLTRYADDITFSSVDAYPDGLKEEVIGIFETVPWTLSKDKIEFSSLPNRLKVHGLLVHGENVRLTKGYRNKLRAYRHLLRNKKIIKSDINKIIGHLKYGDYIENA